MPPPPWAPLQGGTGGTRPTQYFLTLRLWAWHGKNRPQKAFVPLNILRVAEPLPLPPPNFKIVPGLLFDTEISVRSVSL